MAMVLMMVVIVLKTLYSLAEIEYAPDVSDTPDR
jgi:hypothetical protein